MALVTIVLSQDDSDNVEIKAFFEPQISMNTEVEQSVVTIAGMTALVAAKEYLTEEAEGTVTNISVGD